jgi:hypothetical protein
MQGGRPSRPRPRELMAELDEFGRNYPKGGEESRRPRT